ncbi:MAG: ATP-binding domain-containing protein [bacterium]|nr:ATP-binding domain-containing protein [bacterium]
MPDRIVAEELSLLECVNDALASAPVPKPPSETNLVDDLERIREQLVRGEMDFFERSALNTRWNNQSAVLEQLRKSRSAPQVDPDSPYFAHMRIREGERVRDLFLGRATRLDHGLRIVDWRHAPIAQLFYRYQQGEEFEEEITGRIHEGSIEARRAVTIRESRLERVEAPEGTFRADPSEQDGWKMTSREAPKLGGGEGSALRVNAVGDSAMRQLGTDSDGSSRRADKHLPDIAALIDPDQFALIARPSAGPVVIRGAAGSGKTTVALHRIAYLAYEDPQIDSAATLFVVFSSGLRDYVSHVLPALGVERVRVKTFGDWAAEHRRRLFPALPNRHREDTPALAQRLKLHSALLVALDRHIAKTPGEGSVEQVLDDWVSVLTNRDLLWDVFAEHAPDAFSERQLAEATDWCRRRHEECQGWIEGDRETAAELDPEDDALLLRLWQLRVGPLSGTNGQPLEYRHIAIDEVQDFSPLEVQVLMDCLDAQQSLTLAGDTQQHVMQEAGFTSWSDFFRHLGIEGTSVETLQVSYRSSDEIARFGHSVLGPLREDGIPLITTRSGPPVELFHYTDHGACIASLADALSRLSDTEPLASVALLTPGEEISKLYFEGLNNCDVPRLHQVVRQDFSFAPGIEITEIEQVKGLEYDYVVLIDVSETQFRDDAKARRLLHVGATRAVHQLWLTSIGHPSPPVQEAIKTVS